MKKIFYISIIALVAIISGCAKEENAETTTPQVKEPGTHTVVFHAVDGTKTAINEGEKAKFVWTDGDVERLTITENYKVGIIDKDNFSLSTGDGLSNRILTFTASFPVPDPTPDNYVYTAVLASTDGDDNPIVPSEQTTSDGSSYDPDADILVGTYESSDPATELNLSFYRPVAVNKMTLKGLTAGEVVKTVKITSNSNEKPLTGTYNISESSWTNTGSEIVISTNQEVSSEGQVIVFFTTMPVNDATLSIKVITEKNDKTNAYLYEKEFSNTITFTPNKVTRFGVKCSDGTNKSEVKASVNNVCYSTIEDAFSAANSSNTDCTIKLLADCTAQSQLVLNGTATVTLDLNEKTLTTYGGGHGIMVEEGRNFTVIGDGILRNELNNPNDNKYYVIYNNTGKLTIQAGTITSNYQAIRSNGETTISGGIIESTNSTHANSYAIYNSGTCSISGGVIRASRFSLFNNSTSTANISGGTFETEGLGGNAATIRGYSGTVNVTGGYFSNKTAGGEIFTTYNGIIYATGGFYDRAVPTTFTKTSGNYMRFNALNVDSNTNAKYPFTIKNVSGYAASLTTNGKTYRHEFVAGAAKQAQVASSDVTIEMQNNKEETSSLDFTNSNNNVVTLNLNNHILSTSISEFITTRGTLIITDNSENKGGTISSSDTYVVCVTGSNSNVTVSNCKIESTSNKTPTIYYDSSIIHICMDDIPENTTITESIVNIDSAVIAVTGGLAAVSNRNGTLNITNSEILSGLIAVCTGDGGRSKSVPITNINSGLFYSSNTSGTRPAAYICGNGKVTIKDGYFYGGSRSIRAAAHANLSKFTISGGYYNKALSYTTNNETYSPKYLNDEYVCTTISPETTQTLSINNLVLKFGYHVVAK